MAGGPWGAGGWGAIRARSSSGAKPVAPPAFGSTPSFGSVVSYDQGPQGPLLKSVKMCLLIACRA